MKIVDIKNLTKTYNKNRGIINLTFSIEEGEIFGFIGPNGAGKSTTIRTLLNFIYPTSGSATVFGKDIVKDSKEIRQNVGYLPSEIHYYDDMRVIDLLKYSAGFYKKFNPNRMKELAERLDLDLHKKIEDLSFGNRKKVGIVQALLHGPKLLILDEPTSGLDPLMQNTFFELLLEERKKGTTIFFSSHILSEVQKLCDRVAIIKEGELVKVETIENLTKKNLKYITITFEQTEPMDLKLDGIVKKEVNGNEMTLLYSGDMKALLNQLNALPVKDLLIQEPTLEEVFMHYYEK
ncbi:ABC-2 type transport system ATP-binding protein [Thermolongibacillus altinsuensis]|uniref:ABC-2 type transport system ATP-binding protein n=1 Tax=Thermolongibacillus altinsuensis TaxID=575256 RepID=A0A4R1QGM1_9BACL|nr:ABC transporter ATP-binding protein [Thermolongibacillus altinsuensis]TCL48449.1 ABC-2 type transport system ATP-binding protein [Thermolongibacillus altinsuensis]GMB08110.1 ABC transporter ATP-binding protein [Thermolongibacillus altinsuensis]